MSSEVGSSIARRFLAKAFDRAQAAQSRGDAKPVQLLLNQTQCPEFFAIRDLDDARQFRAELAAAERNGAIRLVPAMRMAPPNDVKAVIVTDIDVLAARLGLDVRSTQVAQARERLSPYLDQFPVLDQVLERWRMGRTVRGKAPTAAVVLELLDAIKVRLDRQGRVDEVLLRRASSHLFGNSKRIEALGRWLDLLGQGSLMPSGLTPREVLSSLGLHKEPQPFLMSATDALASNGQIQSRLFRPYHGLPMTAIMGFNFDRAPACVVTVENKSTFHEMAVLAEGTHTCVIYSGGMPSPAWRQVYAKVLASIQDGVPVYHFGDLDVGGFRIARVIAEVAASQGRAVRPWLMDPVTITQLGYKLNTAKAAQVAAMHALSEQLGWHEVGASIKATPGLLEQEHILSRLPA